MGMIAFTWRILGLYSKDELITGIKYLCTGFDGKMSIDSEGTIYFTDPELDIPFAEVTEQQCIEWLEKETDRDGQSHIKTGIQKQFEALEHKEAGLPWKPSTFKMNI